MSLELVGKRIGVLGLGATGRSLAKALYPIAGELLCWDDAPVCKEFDGILQEPSTWGKLDFLFLSPGIPASGEIIHPTVKSARLHGVRILSDIDLLASLYPESKFIGVTGTDGKSTTVSMIGHILTSCGFNCLIGGNLGVPVMALGRADIYVLEVSSFQLDILNTRCFSIALVTNLAPDHLERYGTIGAYYNSKQQIVRFVLPEGSLITDVSCAPICAAAEAQFCCYYKGDLSRFQLPQAAVFLGGGGKILDYSTFAIVQRPSLFGSHGISNALKAAQACRIMGCPEVKISEALSSFKGLPYRLQYLGSHGLVDFYNDSKATNVHAASCALTSLKNIYWLAGGKDSKEDLSPLVSFVSNLKACYFFGQAKLKLYECFKDKVDCSVYEALEDAFSFALNQAILSQEPCTLLLSPAHKSFDQFANFEERGKLFSSLYQRIS